MLLILIMFLPLWDNFVDVFFLELHANWESITLALTESFLGKNLLTDLKLQKRDTSFVRLVLLLMGAEILSNL